MNFVEAIKNTPEITQTTNGAKAFKTTGSGMVDFFYEVPALRKNQTLVLNKWSEAFGEDKITALRTLFWLRDVRGGAGERESFRSIMKQIEKSDYKLAMKLVKLIPEFGRWDDLLVFDSPRVQSEAFKAIESALKEGNGLCAKWMPRKGIKAGALRSHLGLSPKQYRKTLVGLTKVVETQMCSNQWEEIEYSHVPSVASARYRKAFTRHDETRYNNFIQSVNAGEEKINASALFPHDVLKTMRSGGTEAADALWEALPNYMQGGAALIPMIDTSSSMRCMSGVEGFSCMDIAVTLGMYIAMKNEGPFKGAWLNFNSNSHVKSIAGDKFSQVYSTLNGAGDWGGSTNIESAFKSILDIAVKNKLSEDAMPKVLVILSDMQFDGSYHNPVENITSLKMMKKLYKEAGYEIPKIVYWNLNAEHKNVPVKKSKEGVALVSGFNPSILKSLLSGEIQSPEQILLKTVYDSRYDVVEEAVK